MNIKNLIFVSLILCSMHSCVEEPENLIPYDQTGTWQQYNKSMGLAGNGVFSIAEDMQGNMWFGTENRVSVLNTNGKISNYTLPSQVEGNEVYSITPISDGSILMGTNSGFTEYYNGKFTNVNQLFGSPLVVYDIFEDSRKNIWFASYTFGAIYYSPSANRFYQPDYSTCPNCYYANRITEDLNKDVWIASQAGALRYDYSSLLVVDKNRGLPANEVNSIGVDRWGDVWMGFYGVHKVARYNHSSVKMVDLFTDYPTDYVMDIHTDKKGDLWFGLVSSGAIKYDGSKILQEVKGKGLNASSVMCIYSDSKGNIWYGTLTDGVFRYSPKLP